MAPGYHSLILFLVFLLLQFGILNHFQATGSFKQRLKFWYDKANLFRLFRYFIAFNFILLTLHNLIPSIKFEPVIDPSRPLHWLWWLSGAMLSFGLFYLAGQKNIRTNLSGAIDNPVSPAEGVRYYVLANLVMNLGMIMISLGTFYLLREIDDWYLRNGMSQMDWTFKTSMPGAEHKPGFYFALLVAGAAWLFLISAFSKTRDKYQKRHSFLKVLLLSSVLFFGIFSGMYSITNTVYNIGIHGDITKWYNVDKQLGFFAIRLSSLILLFHLLKFILKYVFQSQLVEILMLTFQPKGTLKTQSVALSDQEYSTIFFAQLGFYILNVSVAELSILFQGEKIYRTILDFSLVFIIDDFMIINEYSKKFGQILKWHRLRIGIANAVLFVGGVVTLIQLNLMWYLLLYISISVILLYVSRTNTSRAVTV